MATKLYLPASGTPPLASLAFSADWERSNGAVRLPCSTVKGSTTLTTTTLTWGGTTTVQWIWKQFQSPTLQVGYNWTTADTVSMVIGKCAETTTSGDTHLAYIVKVVSEDGSVVRGIIGLFHATSSEFPLVASAATRIHSARTDGATTFSSLPGDRIVVEIGVHGVTPAAESIQMRFGESAATDFALTAGLTTDLNPWVQLSRTVVFGAPARSGVVVVSGNGSQSGTGKKGGIGAGLASAAGVVLALGLAGMFGVASVSGGGTVTAIGEKAVEQHSGAASVSGGGAIGATGRKAAVSGISLSGSGSATTIGIKNAGGTAVVSANAGATVFGRKSASSGVALSAAGTATVEGRKDAQAGVSISANGGLLGLGRKDAQSSCVVSGGGAATVWAVKSASSGVLVSTAGEVAAKDRNRHPPRFRYRREAPSIRKEPRRRHRRFPSPVPGSSTLRDSRLRRAWPPSRAGVHFLLRARRMPSVRSGSPAVARCSPAGHGNR